MTVNGTEFMSIRKRLGLSEADFASLLGYTGKGKNRVNLIIAFEADNKRIPLYIARLAWLIDRFHAKGLRGGLIEWPDWPGYTREELDAESGSE